MLMGICESFIGVADRTVAFVLPVKTRVTQAGDVLVKRRD